MKRRLLEVARRTGLLSAAGAWFGRRRLTILAYHRIADPDDPGIYGFPANVSATPGRFVEQMGWLASRFSPVTLDEVAAAARGDHELPPKPVLVTFDDGYRDNLTTAAPVLEAHGLSAALFVATDHISSGEPFWWDLAAECFRRAGPGRHVVPLFDAITLETERQGVARAWIEAAKLIPDTDRRRVVAELPGALGVERPSAADAHLSWDEVRSLADAGWGIGAHTCSHPILTRLPPEEAAQEVSGSAERVAAEMGRAPLGFAYPNGGAADFDEATEQAVADAGMDVAFTLISGPMRADELRPAPYRIPRSYIHHADHLSRFAAKVEGLGRLTSWLR
jgi:peptidoglycan/xylan/chitin deacetylase (PgdA/CDA1 family)